ncbi:NAD-dependent DNA ligase [Nile crocodilepox virus]|uniref:NAD+-dependent DNA ligase n=1 Tax=Nile crocodilepox virus (isolate Crocodylus niloticus/Zimbabwe/Ume/2001) TaxID=1289473 RepID=Q070J9_CPRVZ|nr:NAD-dependent DNA ligase [Nile crocodilepox virus]ABJ08943.1 NAD+-dependent DNA ligase [Nile crocodilepox virus]
MRSMPRQRGRRRPASRQLEQPPARTGRRDATGSPVLDRPENGNDSSDEPSAAPPTAREAEAETEVETKNGVEAEAELEAAAAVVPESSDVSASMLGMSPDELGRIFWWSEYLLRVCEVGTVGEASVAAVRQQTYKLMLLLAPNHRSMFASGLYGPRGGPLPCRLPLLEWLCNEQEVEDWLSGTDCDFIVTHKLDGVSVVLVVGTGGQRRLYARGTVSHGQDITHLLPSVTNLPRFSRPPSQMVVRGDLLLIAEAGVSAGARSAQLARAVCGGEVVPGLRFVAHGMPGSDLPPVQQMATLFVRGIETVGYSFVRRGDMSSRLLQHHMEMVRARLPPYDLEGLVVCCNVDGGERAFALSPHN